MFLKDTEQQEAGQLDLSVCLVRCSWRMAAVFCKVDKGEAQLHAQNAFDAETPLWETQMLPTSPATHRNMKTALQIHMGFFSCLQVTPSCQSWLPGPRTPLISSQPASLLFTVRGIPLSEHLLRCSAGRAGCVHHRLWFSVRAASQARACAPWRVLSGG